MTASQEKAASPVFEVWADGACSRNGTSEARAGMGLYVGPDSPHNLSLPYDLGDHPTNNKAELRAIQLALALVDKELPPHGAVIWTDSRYVCDALNEWLPGWKARGWLTGAGKDVSNKNLLVQISETLDYLRGFLGLPVRIAWTKGHTGEDDGNSKADELAAQAIGKTKKRKADVLQKKRKKFAKE